MRIEIEPGSYKDPSGTIFYADNKVYRDIQGEDFFFFKELVETPLFRELVRDQFLIATNLVELKDSGEILKQFGKDQFFEHQKVEFISYPYEWPILMCLDAALITLELQNRLLQNGYSLKDATPYNIQFVHSRPVFIDLCSIEKISDNAVWIACSQFCQMFLYPILLYIYRDLTPRTIYLANIHGVTCEDACKTIGIRAKLKPGLFAYLLLPKILSKLFGSIKLIDQQAARLTKNIAYNRQIQLNSINRMKKLVNSLKKEKVSGHWALYDRTNTYNDEAEKLKMEFVGEIFKRAGIKRVLDLGCNTGTYSKIAAANGAEVIAIDSDHDCINKLYQEVKSNKMHITPLCVDISNPSPSIGWSNKERKSFLERANFDGVLSLALIHHLLISGRHPLGNIVELMSRLTSRYLITEYVGGDDRMFKALMLNRKETYEFYNLEYFKKMHSDRFNILEERSLPNMDRRLFLMEKT